MKSWSVTLRHWWHAFRAAVALDIYDINYGFSSQRFNRLSLPPEALPQLGIVVRFASFCRHFSNSIQVRLTHKKDAPIPNQCIIFFFDSSNQKNSLSPVAQACPGAHLVGLDFFNLLNFDDAYRYPVVFCYLLSLPFFPLVVYKLIRARGYLRKSFKYGLDSYWVTYGFYLFSRIWLKKKEIRAVIVANDHIAEDRALAEAAKAEGSPTFYIQHASATSKFPPLSFDYALLDGRNSLDSYELAGPSQARVFLVGMPKVDAYCRYINANLTVRIIGICTNTLDPLTRVEQLCNQIRQDFPTLPIILRPHPGDKRVSRWIDLAQKYHMEISESKTELSFDFFKRADAIIAGDSNIHLEAALMNVFPIYYDFEQIHRDYYGFQRNGLVEYAAEPLNVSEILTMLLQNKPQVRMKTRPYCATVGTSYDGRSSELAKTIITDVVSNGQVDMSCWKRIQGIKLEGYELASF